MLNHLDKAMDDYNKSISLNAQDSLAVVMRGHTYYKLGSFTKAIQDYDKIWIDDSAPADRKPQ